MFSELESLKGGNWKRLCDAFVEERTYVKARMNKYMPCSSDTASCDVLDSINCGFLTIVKAAACDCG